jgi:predicted amidohydrolase
MGILRDGITGFVTGKVGDMVFYVLNGENVVRHAGKSVKPRSEAQLANQAKMALVNLVLKPLLEFVNIGFAHVAQDDRSNPYNRAVSYNKINAIAGVYPDLLIDYGKVLVSKGKLSVVQGGTVELVAEGLKFGWLFDSDMPYPRENDRAMLLAYFPVLGSAVYSLEGASRKAGADLLVLPGELLAEPMEVYIAFVAANGKSVSNSVYLGRLN